MTDTPAGALGPVEYIVIRFAGDQLTGDIVPALTDLLEQGLVRLIDLAVVSKAADGTVSILETQELKPEVAAAFLKLTGTASGLLSEADLEDLAADLAPGTTAAALPLRARLGHPLRHRRPRRPGRARPRRAHPARRDGRGPGLAPRRAIESKGELR